MRLLDLAHTLGPDIPRFSASLPAPVLSTYMSHAEAAASGRYEGCSCEISAASFVTSLGTYLDSPYHLQGLVSNYWCLVREYYKLFHHMKCY